MVCSGPIKYIGRRRSKPTSRLKSAIDGLTSRRRSSRQSRRPTSKCTCRTNATDRTRTTSSRSPGDERGIPGDRRRRLPGRNRRSRLITWPTERRGFRSRTIESSWRCVISSTAARHSRGPRAFHTCYSVNVGPRIHDPAQRYVDLMLKIGRRPIRSKPRTRGTSTNGAVGGLRCGRQISCPASCRTACIKWASERRPARRTVAQVAGRENVVAGNDCGFATAAAGRGARRCGVGESESLVEGAEIASSGFGAEPMLGRHRTLALRRRG